MATIDNYAINIKVQGADQVTAASTATDNLGKSINNLPLKGLEDASASAGEHVGKLHEGIATLGEKAELLGTAIAGIGMVEFIRNLAEGATTVKDLSEAFGLSIESVLEMESGMARAGRSTESMNKTLYTLSESALTAAGDINGKVMAAFKTLGVTFDDLKTKSESQIFHKIAESLAEAGGSAESMAAAVTVAGRTMKGFVAEDYLAGFNNVHGQMSDAAKGVKEFDDAMKSIEANAMAVKREMLAILAPVAQFFNLITSGSSAAKAEAQVLAGVLLTIGGVMAVRTVTIFIESIKSLSTWLGITGGVAAAAAISTGSMAATQLKSAEASIAQAVGFGRVATAINALNVAKLELNALEAEGIVTGEVYEAQLIKIAAAEGRLAVMQEARAASQLQLNAMVAESAVVGAAATIATTEKVVESAAAVVVAKGAWESFGFKLGQMAATVAGLFSSWAAFSGAIASAGAALVAFVGGPVTATILALTAIGAALAYAFDVHPIDFLAEKLDNLIRTHFPKVMEGLDKIGHALGLAPNPGEKKAGENQSIAEGNRLMDKDKTLLSPATKKGDQEAAANFALMAQIKMNEQLNQQAKERLDLQMGLIGAGEAVKAQAQAALEFTLKQQSEELRLKNEIKRVSIERDNAEKGTEDKYKGQLNALGAQLKAVQNQKDTTSQLVGDIKRAEQAEQARIQWLELEKKIKNNIYGIDEQIADLSRSENEKRLAALDKEIRAEQQAAVARRQSQLGNEGMSGQERASIEQKVADAYANQRAEVVKLNQALAVQNQILFTKDLQYKTSEQLAKLEAESNQMTMTADQQKIAALKEQINLEGLAEIKKREAALGPGGTLSETERLSIMNQIATAYDPIIAKQKELNETARDFSTGWTKAFNIYMDDATNASKMAEQAFSSMTGRMNSAIDNFVDTGKFSFEDFTRSIIQDLIKIELKAQATKLMSALTGGGSDALGGGGFIGSLLGMFGFADGGDPPVGKPSIVGERGPEVFIPKQAGTIMPMTGAGGAPQQNITNETHNYNISAIDSKSVAQLFAENRKALLGTVQLAQKELPYGNR